MTQAEKLDLLKMLYGTVLLVSLVGLGVAIGFGEVKEASSFGLREIVLALALLSQNFSSWAFGQINQHFVEKEKGTETV